LGNNLGWEEKSSVERRLRSLWSLSLFLSFFLSRRMERHNNNESAAPRVLLLLLLLSSSSTSSPCFPLVSRIKTRNARVISTISARGRTPDILSRACTLASFLYERDLFVPKKRRS
jgi:hypothetical protein